MQYGLIAGPVGTLFRILLVMCVLVCFCSCNTALLFISRLPPFSITKKIPKFVVIEHEKLTMNFTTKESCWTCYIDTNRKHFLCITQPCKFDQMPDKSSVASNIKGTSQASFLADCNNQKW